ncbi:LysR family transcriptional regulator [Novosphingobium lentum]|uniref:LysR family transcriptional regulator n=1 Tax=Novosphingobium lentum TaxID=145287 RepID=UPI00082D5AEB|nr:LysR family transcriptional regulator [Novosphingobium lentum]
MIDRYLIRYFLAVVDEGNFSRAAAKCRVAQPTLSVGIAKLEKLVERPLFNRTNRRVELTGAGTRFAVHARRIELNFAEAEREARDDGPSKLIRIGIAATLPTAWIERAVAAAASALPSERLELVEGTARELAPLLERGRIDALIGPQIDALSGPGEGFEPLFGEGYGMAMAASHPLAGRAEVSAADVAGETMIVRRHCEALSEVSRFFTGQGVRPFFAARTTSDERALAYVRAGLGITVMPRCYLQQCIAMPALSGFAVQRTVGLRIEPNAAGRLAGSVLLRGLCDTIRSEALAGPD